MSNFTVRVIVFSVGVPLLLASVILAPFRSHLLFSLIAVVASAGAGWETAGLFPRYCFSYRGEAVARLVLAALLPTVALLHVQGVVAGTAIPSVITGALALVLAGQALRPTKSSLRYSLPSVGAHMVTLLYPGLPLVYIIYMTSVPEATSVIVVFLCSVYLNDTMAYVAGRLFGKRSGLVAVSPGKTRAGFIGGVVTSPVVLVVAAALLPTAFPGALWRPVVAGLGIGVATVFGDLAESSLKRSAAVKDSGNVIPGRGGLLDSIDSPVFVAPFFYGLYHLLFL